MKKIIVEDLREKAGMTEAEASNAYDAVCNAVGRALDRNEKVRLAGVGTLSRKFRDARTGRNPTTGESITIAARWATKFSEAKA